MNTVQPSAVYALDGTTPIRHVVTVLGGASRPLPVNEIAATYRHSVPTDFKRIKDHEGCSTDSEARIWLMTFALSRLGDEQVEEVDGAGFRLKVPPDEVRYLGRPVALLVKEEPDFSGGIRPFDPMSGPFAGNVRVPNEADDLAELRESMREFGWLKQFPAIRDERGVVLVGHRRLKVAAELGIEPEYHDITLGAGKAADAYRFRLALASNIGFRQMTPASRKRIAAYLYGEAGWSMQRIGEALRVNQSQISRDLDLSHYAPCIMSDSEQPHPRRDSRVRKASPGRPTGPPSGSSNSEREILNTLAEHPDGLYFNQLAKLITLSYGTVSGRCSMMRAADLIEGDGRPAIYRLTPKGMAKREKLATPLEPVEPASSAAPQEHQHAWVCSVCGVPHGDP